jgi:hypothetical protein
MLTMPVKERVAKKTKNSLKVKLTPQQAVAAVLSEIKPSTPERAELLKLLVQGNAAGVEPLSSEQIAAYLGHSPYEQEQ